MRHNQKGFTLPELLIGLAISSIIIAASFGSYIVIKNNYDFQKDMKNISQSSRAVATMIMRDVRLAGYNFDDGPGKQNPEITTPIKITDGGTAGPDSIEVIYDQSFTERLKISYYSKPYPNTNSQRSRLYKKVERCDPSVNCSAGSLVTVIPESPIADYVEDLQFTGSKNGNTLGTGTIEVGQGNMRWIVPTSVASDCGGVTNLLYDSNYDSFWECSTSNSEAILTIRFSNHVRITKLLVATAAHLDGGSISMTPTHPYNSAVHPYGTNHLVHEHGHFRILKSDATCALTTGCQSFSSRSLAWTCAGVRGELDTINGSGSDGCDSTGSSVKNKEFAENAVKTLYLNVGNGKNCTYTGTGQACNPVVLKNNLRELSEVQFYGEVYGEPQEPQEVEIGLLIRSPEQHGSTPIAQTWNVGNRPISTNDNYIRDAYSISALVRNKYYE
jgi:prepilin-type N-terminal cleavage/methylation domain-containing protein